RGWAPVGRRCAGAAAASAAARALPRSCLRAAPHAHRPFIPVGGRAPLAALQVGTDARQAACERVRPAAGARARAVRIVETFHVRRPCEVVFDYLAARSTLGEWQPWRRSIEQRTAGPPRRG